MGGLLFRLTKFCLNIQSEINLILNQINNFIYDIYDLTS